MISRQTSLSANIVQFCRYLRQKDFVIGAAEEASALEALACIDYQSRHMLMLGLQATLCRTRAQVEAFEGLFNDYWKELNKAVDSKVKTQEQKVLKPVAGDASFRALKSWLNGNRNEDTEETATYSLAESLSQKDFAMVPGDEIAELMIYIKALARRLAARASRRQQRTEKHRQPDLRRTLRLNMRRGGELLQLAFRKPKPSRTKLVLICDVSKSMELYTSFLLQFMFAFQQVYSRTQTFVFGTRLQNISTLLRQNDFSNAMKQISASNEAWGGGTKIGASLQAFVSQYGQAAVDSKTIVIIMSDGWDTGDADLVSQSMRALQSRCKKLLWLNPLAGYQQYKPQTAGMQAALPYTDVFAPVHNADSLRRLGQWL